MRDICFAVFITLVRRPARLELALHSESTVSLKVHSHQYVGMLLNISQSEIIDSNPMHVINQDIQSSICYLQIRHHFFISPIFCWLIISREQV